MRKINSRTEWPFFLSFFFFLFFFFFWISRENSYQYCIRVYVQTNWGFEYVKDLIKFTIFCGSKSILCGNKANQEDLLNENRWLKAEEEKSFCVCLDLSECWLLSSKVGTFMVTVAGTKIMEINLWHLYCRQSIYIHLYV